jgi:hypothetical protein
LLSSQGSTHLPPPHPQKSAPPGALQHGVLVCRLCHRGIHREYDEMTLARQFNTLTALMGDETLSRHFEWVAKQREQ